MVDLEISGNTCVYCGGPGPFTDEHMFPAGLGGDDKNFMLSDLVCGVCNTEVFSPLEAEFLRRSPVALARLAFQEAGRNRGAKTRAPQMHTDVTEIYDPNSPLIFEAELLPKVSGARILPQILFHDLPNVGLTGSTDPEIRKFIGTLTKAFSGDSVLVIFKDTSQDDPTFVETTYSWDGSNYEKSSESHLDRPSKASKNAVWLAFRSKDPNPSEKHKWSPRLFQRPDGHLSLRIESDYPIEELLAATRIILPSFASQTLPESEQFSGYTARVGMHTKVGVDVRVQAKIGMNFALFVYGDDYLREPAFDGVKKFILSGEEGEVGLLPLEISDKAIDLSLLPKGMHFMALMPKEDALLGRYLMLVLKLYGGPVQVMTLGRNLPRPPLYGAFKCGIDYENHTIKIEREI